MARLSTAIDYSKQSPYLTVNEQAEEIVMTEIAGGKDQLRKLREKWNKQKQEVVDLRQGNFLPLDYYNLDEEDLHPQQTLDRF